MKDLDNEETFVALLDYRAGKTSDKGFYFYRDRTSFDFLSFKALSVKSRAIAFEIRKYCEKGARALLFYPQGLEYITAFFGCLYAGVIAVPVYPPRNNRNFERLDSIIQNSGAELALTTGNLSNTVGQLINDGEKYKNLTLVETDCLNEEQGQNWANIKIDSADIAFLQYTSGSTGNPRGVIVKHENLFHNSSLMKTAFEYDTESHCVSWLPMYHDMGLIGSILQPIYGGYSCSIISPAAFLQTPVKWLQLVSDRKATISGSPNFGYELCVKKIVAEELKGLDLSSWKIAFNGSEPVSSETMRAFSEKFAVCGFDPKAFFPCYGLAETTLFVSGGKAGEGTTDSRLGLSEEKNPDPASGSSVGAGDFVSSGKIYDAEQSVIIFDPTAGKEAAENEIGEIWVRGKSVADGYWNNPEETEKVFRARLPGKSEDHLATGDLGFKRDGMLYVTGRIKDLIIVRGVNHYPQDIEQTVVGLDPTFASNGCAAFSINEAREEYLVVVLEIRRPRKYELADLRTAISRAIAFKHGIEPRKILFTKPNSIPKTTSGKIQRFRCRERFLDGSIEEIAQKNEGALKSGSPENTEIPPAEVGEKKIAGLYADLNDWLSKDENSNRIVEQPNGFAAFGKYELSGLDSLRILELIHLFEKNNRAIGFTEIEESTTLGELLEKAGEISQESGEKFDEVLRSDVWQTLSYGQQGFWFRHQLYKKYSPDNVIIALRIKNDCDIEIFGKAFEKVVARHEILRMGFVLQENELKSRFWESPKTVPEVLGLTDSGEDFAETIAEFAYEKFEIEEKPLFQIRLFKSNDAGRVLVIKFHHSVVDYWSLRIIAAELDFYYRCVEEKDEREIPEPAAQFAEFAAWQNNWVESPKGKEALTFWGKKLSGDLPVFSFPIRKNNAAEPVFKGEKIDFVLDPVLGAELRRFCRRQKTTLFKVVLASYFSILYRLTGQPEQIVGTPFSGRTSIRWTSAVGYFVNPLPLRLSISERDNFIGILKILEREIGESKKHQNYPFHLLVEKLQPKRAKGKSPIFQTMFVFQNQIENDSLNALALGAQKETIKIGSAEFEGFDLPLLASQFELALHVSETKDGILGKFEFDADLFERETIEKLIGFWSNLLKNSVENPETPINGLSILDQSEAASLTSSLSGNRAAVPDSKLIQHFFEEQAEKTPDAEAVVSESGKITYRELNEKAEHLADVLIRAGIGGEKPVGICLPRTTDLPVSILAVFKAGGAYVPLDSNYPVERLRYIVEDSGIETVITCRESAGIWTDKIARRILIEESEIRINGAGRRKRAVKNFPGNLAYIIYTSGSTGLPKGVAIEHRSVVAFLQWCRNYFPPETFRQTLASTSLNFDLSIFELLAPLSTGGTVVMSENALFLPEVMKKREISLVNTVPSAIAELVRTKNLPRNIRTINLAGEPLPKWLANSLYVDFGVENVFNLYGPSEDTTYSTVARIEPKAEKITIGTPLENTRIYLLNQSLQLVPEGYKGEIYISGQGLARGYFGKSEMTAERFLPDPFANEPGGRMYKTGDLGRFLADGRLEYLGRSDSQVKIRGFRIELGEIETVLTEHPAVGEAVVMTVEKHQGIIQLAGFLVLNSARREEFSVGELKSFLQTKLPEFMVPQYFSILETMPLTPNGKIDRSRLRNLKFDQPAPENAFVEPRNRIEAELAGIWKEVLKLERVGVESNFFELGGTSLHLMQIASRIRELYPREMSFRKLFNSFTIEEQARLLATEPSLPPAVNERDAISPVARTNRKAVITIE
ncbi:non-ribosomal peptide synthetase [Planktothrix sp. FACHB-1355]|uniref:non-ribosomal peptide synthetase n=1 Tax=Planktothrix sp. FACHB-1355 TaxID=2692854 RepID=UPI00168B1AE2|nr:non-ribosomal peptide synthetase [Planktothrix sp. FACHB-1355]